MEIWYNWGFLPDDTKVCQTCVYWERVLPRPDRRHMQQFRLGGVSAAREVLQ